jgi:hydrogenase maturation factor HypE
MKIETEKLATLFQHVIHKLKELEIDSVEINMDYYLLISSADWAKVDEDILEPLTGSLVDDWNSLSKVASGDNHVMFVDFDRFGLCLASGKRGT